MASKSTASNDPDEVQRLKREIKCLNARIELGRLKSEIELDFYSNQISKTQEFERQIQSSLREEIRTLRTEKEAVELEDEDLRRDNQALENMTRKLQIEIQRIMDQLETVQKAYIDLRGKSPPSGPQKTGSDSVDHGSADRSLSSNGRNDSKTRSDKIYKDSKAHTSDKHQRLSPDEIVHTTPCTYCRDRDIPCVGRQGRMCGICQRLHLRCEKSTLGSSVAKRKEQEDEGTAPPAKRKSPWE